MDRLIKTVLGEDAIEKLEEFTECPIDLLSHLSKKYKEYFDKIKFKIGKGYSRIYKCSVDGIIYEIHTYQGEHEEYIIFPNIGVCSCRTNYRLDRLKGLICHHIIGFTIDYILGRVIEVKYPSTDIFTLIDDFATFLQIK